MKNILLFIEAVMNGLAIGFTIATSVVLLALLAYFLGRLLGLT